MLSPTHAVLPGSLAKLGIEDEEELSRRYEETHMQVLRLKEMLKSGKPLSENVIQATLPENLNHSEFDNQKKSRSVRCCDISSPDEAGLDGEPQTVELVSTNSRRILKESGREGETFFDRTRERDKKTAEELRDIKIHLLQDEDKHQQDGPIINKKSKQLNRNVDDVLLWKKQRDTKLEDLRLEMEQREFASIAQKSLMSKRSRELVKSNPNYKGIIDVVDRLNMFAKEYEENYQQALEKRINGFTFHPQLVSRPEGSKREGSCSEKLYLQGLLQKETKKILAEICKKQSDYDPDTGLRRYHPQINKTSAKIDFGEPVTSRLYKKAQEYSARLEYMRQEYEKEREELRLTPKMTERSKVLAKRRAKLRTQKKKNGDTTSHRQENPKKLRKVTKSDTKSFYQKSLVWQQRRQRKLNKLQDKLDVAEIKECKYQQPGQKHFVSESDASSVFVRNQNWARNARQKINKAKLQQSAHELDGCTFKPAINHDYPTPRRHRLDLPKSKIKRKVKNKSTDKHTSKEEKKDLPRSLSSDLQTKPPATPFSWDKESETPLSPTLQVSATSLDDDRSDLSLPLDLESPTEGDTAARILPFSAQEMKADTLIAPSPMKIYARRSSAADNQILPPGWEEYTTADGYLYYYHPKSKVTQWEFPLS